MAIWTTIKAYLWVAPYVVIALLIAVVYWYKSAVTTAESRNIQLSTELKAVSETALHQRETITALIELNAKKDKIVAEIGENVAAINDNTVQLGKDLNGLKEANPDVKNLLDLPIPDDLNGLLNR